jgi:hypothetical protein
LAIPGAIFNYELTSLLGLRLYSPGLLPRTYYFDIAVGGHATLVLLLSSYCHGFIPPGIVPRTYYFDIAVLAILLWPYCYNMIAPLYSTGFIAANLLL